ncbi:MAG: TlyA family RNA methyltransferase [Chloroflexi bacterium]|jgi:23S rRNA (cytidine1920-2'-O)/16S rRNA (cytidine1409-2'-O)-methyltransferase|nr:TlyA family RNA methyltransferase [Chloroflexota bacterium]MBT5628329.1 TlyA family RNA methyltransferase [Chloroflexota bacterium]
MPSNSKIRLDQLLVDRELAPDITEAAALVMAGKVTVPQVRQSPTPGMQVRPDIEIEVAPEKRFVSRGGEKLAKALELFDVDIAGTICLDVGASTGGFTDCLLQSGATRVYAVDTGRGQLHQKLLSDERVINMERTNLVDGIGLPEQVDLVVADVSFTSLSTVLPTAFDQLKPDGQAIVLLKPQFEAKKIEVPRGGVITDPNVHALVIGRFVKWAVGSKIRIHNLVSSGILGGKGNREFLLHLEVPTTDSDQKTH